MTLKSNSRVIIWFSCGEASAIAAKFAIEKYPHAQVVYCDTMKSEHPDNARFFEEVSGWIERPITTIRSKKYDDIDDVFESERYMSGVTGARCTMEMKKVPRVQFQQPDDLHIFGYCVDEAKRMTDFRKHNPALRIEWILGERFIRKVDCGRILEQAGIRPPVMYRLGFEHNNCLGCVKAQSPSYWARTAKLFPDVFALRATQSREIGARLVRIKGKRYFLDEMDVNAPYSEPDGDIECGPYCVTR